MNQYRRKPGRKEHSAAAFSKYRRENRAKCLITTARHRATVKGIPFTLSPEDIDRLQAVIDAGHCQVTGLPFDLDSGKAWNSPSIDRIDSNLGYTPENVRVTLYCVNVMANTWGVEKVVEIGEAIRGAQEERRFGFQNRLSARLKSMISLDCSLEYSLNWKDTQTESGMVIPRLVASPKKTNQSPWPTPQAHDKQGGKTQEQIQAMRLRSNAGVANLNEVCQLAPWPTPNAEEFGAVDMEKMEARRLACQERTGNGNGFGLTLGQAVRLPPDSGTTAESSPAATARRGGSRLNKKFSLWLMGYPVTTWLAFSPFSASAESTESWLRDFYERQAEIEQESSARPETQSSPK